MPTKKVVQITPEIEDILRSARIDGTFLSIDQKLDRRVYEAVNKVLAALGGRWNRSAQAHVFSRPVEDVLNDALDAGEAVDIKKTYDVYETPQPIIERMLLAAKLDRLDTGYPLVVLEPSAGSGRLVKAIRNALPDAHIVANEIRDCEIDGSPNAVFRQDFLTLRGGFNGDTETFDLIFANPPFSNGLDVKHVIHMLSFATYAGAGLPTTRLVTIMSPHYSFSGKKECVAFRRWLGKRLQDGGDVREEQLPEGAFSESGTEVGSRLIALDVTQDDAIDMRNYLRELSS